MPAITTIIRTPPAASQMTGRALSAGAGCRSDPVPENVGSGAAAWDGLDDTVAASRIGSGVGVGSGFFFFCLVLNFL